VRFTPLTRAKLVDALSDWVLDQAGRLEPPAGAVIGFDGLAEIGTADLADEVAATLRGSGRQIIRASTAWWWRPSALRLELGRQDVDMLLTGWVDAGALSRELVGPVRSGGSAHITRLRDPATDRSVRQAPATVLAGAILLLDGPYLLAAGLPLDAVVAFAVSRGRLTRALPTERHWWADAFEKYQDDYAPADRADVLLSYDHAAAPAASGLPSAPFR
jgi:hypothetical protein